MDVRGERTGWRDERLSERHRFWGWDCPAVDIDFLMIEYDRACPKALVEYKHESAALQRLSGSASIDALARLGDLAALPVFGVRYADDFSWFRVTALNGVAERFMEESGLVPTRGFQMDEAGYVRMLYLLRGRDVRIAPVGEGGAR